MNSINSVGPIQPIGALTPQGRRNAADPNAPGSPAPASVKSAPARKETAASAAALDQSNQGFSFEFEDTLDGMSVKIIDKRTQAVLRLVPSHGLLAPARSQREAGAGRGSEEQGLNQNAMKAGS
jgi:hypothetical protein